MTFRDPRCSQDTACRVSSRADHFRGGLPVVSEKRRSVVAVTAASRDEEFDLEGEAIADNYYSILGLVSTASGFDLTESRMQSLHPEM